MHFRRKIALALSGAVLAVPALTSCGFNYATDRPYTPAAGVNNQDGTVDVLGAVIVSGQDDSGTFIPSFSNNDADQGRPRRPLRALVHEKRGGGGGHRRVAVWCRGHHARGGVVRAHRRPPEWPAEPRGRGR